MREKNLLQHIYRHNPSLPESVVIPPGDDMAAIDLGGRALLVAVDPVLEGVHFDLAKTPIEKVGRKAVTRNLSDCAAMAVKPVGAVAQASLPRSLDETQAKKLFDAARDTAAAFGCPLVGGDISVWDGPLLLGVTVFAESWPGIAPVQRKGSLPGDGLYVTGYLGGSLPTGHHLDFTPRVELARRLAEAVELHAMMDLSDGLSTDLPRLVEHAELDAARLPIRPGAVQDHHRPAWHHALGDGEDYELLFASPGSSHAAVPNEIEGVPITRVGTVTDAGGIVVTTPGGTRLPLSELGGGWEHGEDDTWRRVGP
ncbi:MAG: thiamine-phosphate kinase [Planctomycetota bacterium]